MLFCGLLNWLQKWIFKHLPWLKCLLFAFGRERSVKFNFKRRALVVSLGVVGSFSVSDYHDHSNFKYSFSLLKRSLALDQLRRRERVSDWEERDGMRVRSFKINKHKANRLIWILQVATRYLKTPTRLVSCLFCTRLGKRGDNLSSKPLQIWDKEVRNGHIKRITDQDIQSSVLEIMGTNVSTSFITCPAEKKSTLGIKLPFLVMIIKNVSQSHLPVKEILHFWSTGPGWQGCASSLQSFKLPGKSSL